MVDQVMQASLGLSVRAMGRIRYVHFVGIGGSGMSGIAGVLLNLGYRVSGSDIRESATLAWLRELGAEVSIGHRSDNICGCDAVVISSAVTEENPEVRAARGLRIPVVPRAEMLAELMRFRFGVAVAGTHGKTTTTSLIASLLTEAGLDPTYVIGGRLNSSGSNARLGAGEVLVAEADESDASFLYLQPMVAVVTNIDRDHMATYEGDFGRLRETFVEFIHHLPFYGLAVLCNEDPQLRKLLPSLSRPVRTYGFCEGSDVRASGLRAQGTRTHFTLHCAGESDPQYLTLNLPGAHNVLNALAAITVARELGVSRETIARALEGFQGIGRRFHVTESVQIPAGQCTLVDDYGHHPRELAATIAAARDSWPQRRLVVIFQPHRFSRTHELFDDFVIELARVECLLLTEVYPAGEVAIAGASGRDLSRAVRVRGGVVPVFVDPLEELPGVLAKLLQDGDVVLTLGAGDIGALAARLPKLLAAYC